MLITDHPIHIDERSVSDLDHKFGAVATFAGVVRDHHEGRPVTGIFYDCYHDMAQREMARIVEDMQARLPVKIVKVAHRIGEVGVGEISLLVIVASAHRSEAFEGCQKMVEAIKHRLPIWKKERYADGAAEWL
ncbi:MAG: molybdenum cofactor biosynthesis protein MoaE [Candidatus Krumholzibacteria bacterium]|nr:molybdenum cofactor biosynthesis protein MoaE [Candidatus Krumholzibacteria bacterium]